MPTGQPLAITFGWHTALADYEAEGIPLAWHVEIVAIGKLYNASAANHVDPAGNPTKSLFHIPGGAESRPWHCSC
jgi:hypothetical protein